MWHYLFTRNTRNEWNGSIVFNHGSANSCGIAILFHTELDSQITQPKCDNQGCIIATKITLDNQELNLVYIYCIAKYVICIAQAN